MLPTSFEGVGEKQPYYALQLPPLDDSHWKLADLTNSNQNIAEDEWKGKLNFTLPISNGLYGNTLKFGAKYTNKHKTLNKSFYDYDIDEVLGSDCLARNIPLERPSSARRRWATSISTNTAALRTWRRKLATTTFANKSRPATCASTRSSANA